MECPIKYQQPRLVQFLLLHVSMQLVIRCRNLDRSLTEKDTLQYIFIFNHAASKPPPQLMSRVRALAKESWPFEAYISITTVSPELMLSIVSLDTK